MFSPNSLEWNARIIWKILISFRKQKLFLRGQREKDVKAVDDVTGTEEHLRDVAC